MGHQGWLVSRIQESPAAEDGVGAADEELPLVIVENLTPPCPPGKLIPEDGAGCPEGVGQADTLGYPLGT